MSNSMNNQAQEKVLGLLLMRYKVSPTKSIEIAKQWINSHSDATWKTLEESIRNNLVRFDNDELIDLYEQKIAQLVIDMRGIEGIEIKDRNYRLKNYAQCFIGSEIVKWMQNQYGISKSEAIKLGQILIDEKIIHHVTDDHQFKSDYLFYRFYMDE